MGCAEMRTSCCNTQQAMKRRAEAMEKAAPVNVLSFPEVLRSQYIYPGY